MNKNLKPTRTVINSNAEDWFESIPKEGILCWVWNNPRDCQSLWKERLVTRYIPEGYNKGFELENGGVYKMAIPVL